MSRLTVDEDEKNALKSEKNGTRDITRITGESFAYFPEVEFIFRCCNLQMCTLAKVIGYQAKYFGNKLVRSQNYKKGI